MDFRLSGGAAAVQNGGQQGHTMKLKSYDIATGTITELHSHDNFRDTYMTTDGRLYVLNNKLYYFTPTFNHHAFPVYDLGTGEVKYWCP